MKETRFNILVGKHIGTDPQSARGLVPNRSPKSSLFTLLVILAAVIVYLPAIWFDFVNFDDPHYVVNNPVLKRELSLGKVVDLLTAVRGANWHPLTLASLAADYSLNGPDPRVFHFTNILLHAINCALLFHVLRRATGSLFLSLFSALFLAVHPLHVESVAWVSARKDVLSMFFMLASLMAYLRYAARPSRQGYVAMVLLFSAGLLAKPMIVSLPLLFLLLDYWPLSRYAAGGVRNTGRSQWWLCLEKLPMVIIACASGIVTFLAQQRTGAVGSGAEYPLAERLSSASTAYLLYLRRLFWPMDLAVYYPHPHGGVFTPAALLALLALVALSSVAWLRRSRQPSLIVGWSWFLLSLVPAIGLVQVGSQHMADRYAYIPFIGLYVVVFSLLEGHMRSARLLSRVAITVIAIGATVALGAMARAQTRHWRDSLSLFRHALEKADRNALALSSYANALIRTGQWGEAEKCLREALEINPEYVPALRDMGRVALAGGRLPESERMLRRALQLDRDSAETLNNLGVVLELTGRFPEAEGLYRESLEVDPSYAGAYHNLGLLYQRQGRTREAEISFSTAREVDPDFHAPRGFRTPPPGHDRVDPRNGARTAR